MHSVHFHRPLPSPLPSPLWIALSASHAHTNGGHALTPAEPTQDHSPTTTDSAVENTGRSSRRPEFWFLAANVSLQPSIAPVPGPSVTSMDPRHVYSSQAYHPGKGPIHIHET